MQLNKVLKLKQNSTKLHANFLRVYMFENEWMFCPFKTSTEWTKFMDNFTATDQEPTPELFGIPDVTFYPDSHCQSVFETGISSGYHLLHSEFDGSLLEESPLTFDKHLNIPFGGIVRDVNFEIN